VIASSTLLLFLSDNNHLSYYYYYYYCLIVNLVKYDVMNYPVVNDVVANSCVLLNNIRLKGVLTYLVENSIEIEKKPSLMRINSK